MWTIFIVISLFAALALLACESSDFLQHYIYASLIDMYSKKWRKKHWKTLTRLYEQAAIDLNLMHNLEACSKWQRSGLFWIFQSPQRSAALQACVNMAKKRSPKAASKLFCTRARVFVLLLFLVWLWRIYSLENSSNTFKSALHYSVVVGPPTRLVECWKN